MGFYIDERKTFYKEQKAGGDLLFRGLSQSTIGAEDFQGRVRDGIVCGFLAMPTSFLPLLGQIIVSQSL